MLVVLVLASLLLSAQAVKNPKCGSWSKLKNWHCHQLAPNYALYWKVTASTTSIAFAVDVIANKDLSGGLKWVSVGTKHYRLDI